MSLECCSWQRSEGFGSFFFFFLRSLLMMQLILVVVQMKSSFELD